MALTHPFRCDEARQNVVGLGLALTALGSSIYGQAQPTFGFSGPGVDVILSAWTLVGYLTALLALLSVLAHRNNTGYRISGLYFMIAAGLTLSSPNPTPTSVGTSVLYLGFAVIGYGTWLISRERAYP
ncbi:hypothetical protein ACIGXM_14085 [Kitasatospora sp. NPDC052896]|uniref:hypothetical protein n=1 Tax=Kitasatospora sp. NPDC052896 TaxID=3364061 RepID=UPI0037C7FF31